MSNNEFFAGTGVHFGGVDPLISDIVPASFYVESYIGGTLFTSRAYDASTVGYDAAMREVRSELKAGRNACLRVTDAAGVAYNPDTCAVMFWRRCNGGGTVKARRMGCDVGVTYVK